MVVGKVIFAIVMGLGVIISFANRDYNMALFFAAILAVMVWIIKTRPKADLELRR